MEVVTSNQSEETRKIRNLLRASNSDWRDEKNFPNESPLSTSDSEETDARKWRRYCIGRIEEVRNDALESDAIEFEWFWAFCSSTHRRKPREPSHQRQVLVKWLIAKLREGSQPLSKWLGLKDSRMPMNYL